MLQFWERAEDLRRKHRLSKEALCEEAGIILGTYNGWIYKDVLPNGEVSVSLAQVLNTSVEYLVTGVGETYDFPLPTLYTPRGAVEMHGEEPTMVVPIVPQKLSAGYGQEFLAPDEALGHVRILSRMARGINPTTLVAAEVKGDSMTGVQIFSGDVVIFARGMIEENGIYVVALDGNVLVKRLEFNPVERTVRIISENKNYAPMVIATENNDRFTILGKVVGWIHNHPY